MSKQFNQSSVRAFPCAVALGEGVSVKFAAGLIVAAVAGTDKIIGVTDVANDAGQDANVRLRSGSGSAIFRAGGNIAVGDYVTATTAGEHIATVTAGNEIVGLAIETAADDGFFEALLWTGTVKA
jgi:hypothetical protein